MRRADVGGEGALDHLPGRDLDALSIRRPDSALSVVVVAVVESPKVTVTLKLPSGTLAEKRNGLSLVVVLPLSPVETCAPGS